MGGADVVSMDNREEPLLMVSLHLQPVFMASKVSSLSIINRRSHCHRQSPPIPPSKAGLKMSADQGGQEGIRTGRRTCNVQQAFRRTCKDGRTLGRKTTGTGCQTGRDGNRVGGKQAARRK